MSTKMQFIKYKNDFYSKLQEENMKNFEKLTDLYLQNVVDIVTRGKLSTADLEKLVKESQAAFDEMSMITYQKLSSEYLDQVKREVTDKFAPNLMLF